MQKVKIWFQNRRTKWKKQDNVPSSDAVENKSSTTTTKSGETVKQSLNEAAAETVTTTSKTTFPTATTTTTTTTKKSLQGYTTNNNNNHNKSTEKNRSIAGELSAKLSAKQATKIKKQLNALLEKSTNKKQNLSGNANKAGVTTSAATNHEHYKPTHGQHAIALTVEPAAPLEQTEKLEIKLEESPQHRELQLKLLRVNNLADGANLFSEMDFESKLAASKITNALALNKLGARASVQEPLTCIELKPVTPPKQLKTQHKMQSTAKKEADITTDTNSKSNRSYDDNDEEMHEI